MCTWPQVPANRSMPRTTTGRGTPLSTLHRPGSQPHRPCAKAFISAPIWHIPLTSKPTIPGASSLTSFLHMEFEPTSAGEIVRLDMIVRSSPASAPFQTRRSPCQPEATSISFSTARPSPPPIRDSPSPAARARASRLTYSEALYDKDQHKGDRDEWTTARPSASPTAFCPTAASIAAFEPLWWRTWRYLDLDIQTAAEPLHLESLTANFTAYPVQGARHLPIPRPGARTKSGRSVGAPHASTPMKPTWTRPTTSSSSTWATRASRRSSLTP